MIVRDADGMPRSADYGDVYHPRAGRAGAGAPRLPRRQRACPRAGAAAPRFVVLETGFGLGNNFLATWDAWRADARRCARLHFIAIEKHPPTPRDLARVHARLAAARRWPMRSSRTGRR